MTLYLKVNDSRIEEATFKTMGCSAAIATGSILTEMLKGKSVEEARAISPSELIEALGGLPKIKLHCPELTIEALQNALKKVP
jgi:nitrogen fixation protein NifU and related proteins